VGARRKEGERRAVRISAGGERWRMGVLGLVVRGFQEDGSVSRAWESELVEEDCGRGCGGAGDGVGCRVKKWEEDMGASREVSNCERERVRFVVGWFLDWAGKMGVEGTVEDGRRFWREVVLRSRVCGCRASALMADGNEGFAPTSSPE